MPGTIKNEEVFRNDPFTASFSSGGIDFLVVLIHTRLSNDAEGARKKEVLGIADEIKKFTKLFA